jgi:hypothetical protein
MSTTLSDRRKRCTLKIRVEPNAVPVANNVTTSTVLARLPINEYAVAADPIPAASSAIQSNDFFTVYSLIIAPAIAPAIAA